MATRKPKKRIVEKNEVLENPVVMEPSKKDVEKYLEPKNGCNCKKRMAIGTGVLLVVLLGYWFKTNTWPVAALVDGRVIFRSAVDKNLYQQGGKVVLDNMITEQIIKNELDKQKVTVSDQEVTKKLDEIKTQLPPGNDLASILASRGMTEADLKKQIEFQMRLEKAVASKITVSNEELDKYVTENNEYLTGTTSAEKKDNAMELLKSQKSQEEVAKWVENLRKSAKVWTPDGSWKPETVNAGN